MRTMTPSPKRSAWKLADKGVRREIICEAQRVIRNDMVNAYFVHPLTPQVVNTDVFNADSVVTQAGIGVHNFWTWIGIEPIGRRDHAHHLDDLLPQFLQPDGDRW